MTVSKQLPEWPFYPTDTACGDFCINQTLSIHLNDDTLRTKLIEKWGKEHRKMVQSFPSAYHADDTHRSRPYSHVPPGGHRKNAWLVAGLDAVKEVLSNPDRFSNVPYAELGDRSFVLALDPVSTKENPEAKQLYDRQKNYLSELIQKPTGDQLSQLAIEAVRHAEVAGLTRNRFDLAELAEQAAIRFCGLWFGFASKDHGLIQNTAAASYRALVYLILGRHFGSEPTVIPQARAAMAELTERASALITEYRKVYWQPREVHGNLKHRVNRANWPEGVTPTDEWSLSGMGPPLLQRMALENHDFTVAELASMATGLIAGTVGNVQASACAAIQQIFVEQVNYQQQHNNNTRTAGPLHDAINEAKNSTETVHIGSLHERVGQLLIQYPPVAYLPRRAVANDNIDGIVVNSGDDIILWLTAASHLEQLNYKDGEYGLPFGTLDEKINVNTNRNAQKDASNNNTPAPPHSCLGTTAARTLVTAIVRTVLRLPSIAEVIDSATGKPEGLKRNWGFSCESYPLTHKRAMRIAQQPLNVIMRVKTPTDFHSTALKHIIHAGAPRIEKVLKYSGHVHFAWFQFLDNGRYLALHTVYDGDFYAYIQDFALKVDDLFDLLFQHLEDAPPLPVAENPGEFVNAIRANNAPSVNGYFFSASPTVEVSAVARAFPGQS